MTLQFIQDNRGTTTGVFIPIKDWHTLTAKSPELQKEEEAGKMEAIPWQKRVVENSLASYYQNPDTMVDFDKILDDFPPSFVSHKRPLHPIHKMF